MTTIREAVEAHALEMAATLWPDKTKEAPRCEIGDRTWFVVQSAIQAEKKARQVLIDDGHEVYLPTVRTEIFYRQRRRWKVREFLMFNRYIFARLPCDTRHWRAILRADPIAHILGVNGVPQPIPDGDIIAFMKAQASGAFDNTENSRHETMLQSVADRKAYAHKTFPKGTSLRATRGRFGGFSGLVQSVTGRGTVKVMIALFNQLIPVEFDLDEIEPVGRADANHLMVRAQG